MLVMDVDGTLTDRRIYIGDHGEVMKAFDVHDGYAIAHILPKNGIIPVIITGRKSKIVERRAEELGITEVYQGVMDKRSKLLDIAKEKGILEAEIAGIGDDVNDLSYLTICGLSACPSDAEEKVKETVNYVCKRDGGRGAVREFIDYLSITHQ